MCVCVWLVVLHRSVDCMQLQVLSVCVVVLRRSCNHIQVQVLSVYVCVLGWCADCMQVQVISVCVRVVVLSRQAYRFYLCVYVFVFSWCADCMQVQGDCGVSRAPSLLILRPWCPAPYKPHILTKNKPLQPETKTATISKCFKSVDSIKCHSTFHWKLCVKLQINIILILFFSSTADCFSKAHVVSLVQDCTNSNLTYLPKPDMSISYEIDMSGFGR